MQSQDQEADHLRRILAEAEETSKKEEEEQVGKVISIQERILALNT